VGQQGGLPVQLRLVLQTHFPLSQPIVPSHAGGFPVQLRGGVPELVVEELPLANEDSALNVTKLKRRQEKRKKSILRILFTFRFEMTSLL